MANENKVPCEVYSRIVGYLRPVQNWNDGKRQEFADRQPFNIGTGPPPAAATASERLQQAKGEDDDR